MQLGKWQTMTIKAIKSPGAILTDNILLPNKFVPKNASPGDRIEVFIMRDSDDRLMATNQEVKVEVGKFAYLQVKDLGKMGAFLDWGPDKDLFLPFKEQTKNLKIHDFVLIYCYIDKSDRICASMKVKKYFTYPKNLRENDWVDGQVYAINKELGAFVLVNKLYNGMIAKDKIRMALREGQKIRLRVEMIKKDGKIDLSMESRAYEILDQDAEKIYKILEGAGGFLPFNDSSEPELIKKKFDMSKGQFKRGLGRLYKKKMIVFKGEGIAIRSDKNKDN